MKLKAIRERVEKAVASELSIPDFIDLLDAFEEALGFAWHKYDCSMWEAPDGSTEECTCGYEAFLAKHKGEQ